VPINLKKIKKVIISDPGKLFYWEITSFDDVTQIQYFENEKLLQTLTLTTGYDIEVFEAALELRRES